MPDILCVVEDSPREIANLLRTFQLEKKKPISEIYKKFLLMPSKEQKDFQESKTPYEIFDESLPFKIIILPTVKVAKEFFEKISKLPNKKDNIVTLMDYTLPDGNGSEVVKYIREILKLDKTQFPILGHSTSPEYFQKDGVMSELNELLTKIGNVMANSETDAQKRKVIEKFINMLNTNEESRAITLTRSSSDLSGIINEVQKQVAKESAPNPPTPPLISRGWLGNVSDVLVHMNFTSFWNNILPENTNYSAKEGVDLAPSAKRRKIMPSVSVVIIEDNEYAIKETLKKIGLEQSQLALTNFDKEGILIDLTCIRTYTLAESFLNKLDKTKKYFLIFDYGLGEIDDSNNGAKLLRSVWKKIQNNELDKNNLYLLGHSTSASSFQTEMDEGLLNSNFDKNLFDLFPEIKDFAEGKSHNKQEEQQISAKHQEQNNSGP